MKKPAVTRFGYISTRLELTCTSRVFSNDLHKVRSTARQGPS